MRGMKREGGRRKGREGEEKNLGGEEEGDKGRVGRRGEEGWKGGRCLGCGGGRDGKMERE